jgi:hypothetical protein
MTWNLQGATDNIALAGKGDTMTNQAAWNIRF